MIIRITSKLFTTDPDSRFAIEQNLPRGLWNDLWRRYKFLGYTPGELKEFYHLKAGKETNINTINRWIFRTEIYHKVQPAVKKGAQAINTEVFGEFEEKLIQELTKQYRNGVKRNNRIII